MQDADAYDSPAMSRVASKTAEVVELRFDVTAETASRIDAVMMVDRLRSRGDWLIPVIEKALEAEFHRATVLLRCAGINPLDSTSKGSGGAT